MKRFICLVGILSFLMLFPKMLLAQRMNINPLTDLNTLEKWEGMKLGMFVHWMVCHSPETGDSWSIGQGTPKSVADSITLQWNPQKFDAKEMVGAAVKAGCKYMVIVAKHHDGFAIWDSDYSSFDLERVAFKRDILKETSEECKKQGIMFGVYLSIADIDYMGWDRMYSDSEVSPEPKTGRIDFMRYTKGQVKEIIRRYDPEILWWDGYWQPPVWTPVEGKILYDYVKSLNPHIICPRPSLTEHQSKSNTFYAFSSDGADGDYFAIEGRTIEAAPYPWEIATAITYPTYAYEENARLLSKEKLITLFNNSLCGNGNMLLNIAPKPDGTFDAKQLNRFYDLTEWIKRNEPAVYGTEGGPLRQGKWGGTTFKGNKIYIHLRDKVRDLKLNSLKGYKIQKIKDLYSGKDIQFETDDSGMTVIHLPEYDKELIIPVIELTVDRVVTFTKWLPLVL